MTLSRTMYNGLTKGLSNMIKCEGNRNILSQKRKREVYKSTQSPRSKFDEPLWIKIIILNHKYVVRCENSVKIYMVRLDRLVMVHHFFIRMMVEDLLNKVNHLIINLSLGF